jgi:hypothetical protein
LYHECTNFIEAKKFTLGFSCKFAVVDSKRMKLTKEEQMKLNHTNNICMLIALLLITSTASWAELEVKKVGDSVVDGGALTIQGGFGQAINGLSFQQDAVATHGTYQYVGYYDGQRRVCLARRKLPAGGVK